MIFYHASIYTHLPHTDRMFSSWDFSWTTCFFRKTTSSACLFSSKARLSASVLSAASSLALCSASCLLSLSFSDSSSSIFAFISAFPCSASNVFLIPNDTADSYSV
eukprot:XP_001705274.1 Hypothetical protein GL50803_19002 [Giardia lamblia ATCC 50803]